MNEFIFHSPLAPVDIPELHITEYVLRKGEERPDHPAIIDGVTGTSYTFAELTSRIRQLAGGLRARGFNSGDVLALIAPNCPDYAVVFHATALCGGTVTTVNPTYGIAEVRQQLIDSNTSWIVADQSCVAIAKQAMRGTNSNHVFCLQEDGPASPIQDLLANEVDQVPVNLHSHPVVLPYSSGTTGFPKGVMLSHQNLVANLVQTNAVVQYDDYETGLAILPFFHIYGMQVLMGSMLSQGHTIVTLPRFDMDQALGLIQQHQVTQFFAVPPIILGLAKSPLVNNYDLSSLKKVISGAAPLGGDLAAEAGKRIDCAVVQAYGMTELSPVSHCTPGYDAKPGSSGVTVPNTQSRIVDTDGNDLPHGREGELLVKGPQVMVAYLNNHSATSETLDADGWLHTGDVGVIDEDGYLTIVDRVKELIKYKGFQVAPAELEALLITHPAVADVAVVGIADEEAGEVPKAFIVLSIESQSLDDDARSKLASELKAFVGSKVAKYKVIDCVQWVDKIPKSPSGKILRRMLRDEMSVETA